MRRIVKPFDTYIFVSKLSSGIIEKEVLVNPHTLIFTPHTSDMFIAVTAISNNGTHTALMRKDMYTDMRASLRNGYQLEREFTGRTHVATEQVSDAHTDDTVVTVEVPLYIRVKEGCRVYFCDAPDITVR